MRLALNDPEKVVDVGSHAAPALVSPEVAQQVHERLKKNAEEASRHNRHPEATLLRGGFAKCGVCGGNMTARSDNSGAHNTMRFYYVCARMQNIGKGQCKNNITVAQVDGVVWSGIRYVIEHPEIIQAERERRKNRSCANAAVAASERRIKAIEKERANLASAIARSADPDEAAPFFELSWQLNDEKKCLEAQLQEAGDSVAIEREVQSRLEQIEKWLTAIKPRYDALTCDQKRLLLFALGIKVTIFPIGH
jgi:site-specific DNA recombinase